MKKKFVVIMSSLLTFSLLTGCSSGSNTAPTVNNTPTETKKEESKKEEPKKEEAKAPEKQVILRLANNHAPDYPTSQGADYFAQLVEERTEGRIKIETYHSAQLGEEKSTIEQAQFGGIDFVRTSISPLAEFSDNLNALQLPYLYRDAEHMWKVLEGEIGDEFLESIEPANLIGLAWYDGGTRNFYNSKKEVKSVADLKGMKIRVQESKLMMGLVEELGGVPTPMPFGDVYSALQTGVIEGAENNWPSYISTSHFEVAKFFTVDEHTRVPEMLFASKKSMDKLSADDKEIIKQAAVESGLKQRELWANYSKEAEQKAIDAGCTITYLESTEEFQRAMDPLYATEGEKYKEVIEKIRNVQ